MTHLEIGHQTWSRPDADRVARALLDHDTCTSVRLVPPEGPCGGWGIVATYADDGLASPIPERAGGRP